MLPPAANIRASSGSWGGCNEPELGADVLGAGIDLARRHL